MAGDKILTFPSCLSFTTYFIIKYLYTFWITIFILMLAFENSYN